MRVYIAELSHTGGGVRSPNVVPLAAGYLAAAATACFPDIEVKIFREPDRLLAAVRETQPDILGFSIHTWSERLSTFCAEKARQVSDDIVIAAGGSSVDDIDAELLRFLTAHPSFDACVPSEGEPGFLALIDHVAQHGRLVSREVISGCATLAPDGTLLRGSYAPPDLSTIPSPYLDGHLDEFLSDGYEPIIQSMRGCPYGCKFCVSGSKVWSRVRAFDLERVFLELDYVREHTTSDRLILTDENLGVLRQRDVELAERILQSHKELGFPSRLYYYTSKIVTEYTLQIVETLAPIGEFGMSFQTLDEDVRKDISRTNLSFDDFLKYVAWATERGIVTSTEMIFGFPGETVDGYITGIERLLRSGVDRVYSYNLRLFEGIDLATEENRARYGYETMYRLPERTFGVYDGEVVTEVEEVVTGSTSFTFEDYLLIRKYGLFLELASGRGYLSELMRLLASFGAPAERLIRFLSDHDFERFPRVRSIVGQYMERARGELLPSPEDVFREIERHLAEDGRVPEVKLNLIFTGKIMLDIETRREFLDAVREFCGGLDLSPEQARQVADHLQLLDGRVVGFGADEADVVTLEQPAPEREPRIDLELHNDARMFIAKSPVADMDDEATIQDVYMTVSRFGLLRTVAPRGEN